MKRNISFQAPEGEAISITLDGGNASFKIGYCETGKFSQEEIGDILDCLSQLYECM